MPTLIRLIVVLLILAGLGYGAMFGLATFVEPRDKDVTIRIPARDLMPSTQRDPLVRREIDTTREVPPATPATDTPAPETPAPAAPAAGGGQNGDIVTLEPGVE